MTNPSVKLQNEFVAAWQAGNDHDALLDLVRRHRIIAKLREVARTVTKELKSPIMRFLQIEEWARKNAQKLGGG